MSHTVRVHAPTGPYDVHVGRGAASRLPEIIAKDGVTRRILVIADEAVANLHLPELRKHLPADIAIARVASGEASKSLASAAGLYDQLAAARIGRRDLIITFGGGVIGDLGGFVAATWNRGVSFVQVPTTIEAAVDASVGGKTAINHPAGKNLIGAFHQPAAVLIDLDFLATLPHRDYVAGLAESVKHAAIRDPAFLDWHERMAPAILAREESAVAELVARNCAIKADVVSQDVYESGVRAILNYGHTIGHAIEHVAAYALRHGECVALGIVAENHIAVARGLLDAAVATRIRRVMEQLELPTRLPVALANSIPIEAVIAACRLDKKARAGAVHFVLLAEIGRPVEVADVTDDQIAAASAALL